MAEPGLDPELLDQPCGEFCAACEEESFCPHAYSGNCMRFYLRMEIPRTGY